jgi:hypothetical protein
MSFQFSPAARNAALDAIEAAIGTAPKLQLRSGTLPDNTAEADAGKPAGRDQPAFRLARRPPRPASRPSRASGPAPVPPPPVAEPMPVISASRTPPAP